MSTVSVRVWCSTLVLAALCLTPLSASAQPGGASKSQTPVEQARTHYERGLQLYSEQNYEAALVEFERAYQIAPSYKILYNTGLIHKQLNNYVASLTAFERYLAEGGTSVPEDRRQEVQRYIDQMSVRVARLTIRTNIPEADVSVDDVPVGKAPLGKAVFVNPGRRKVTASKPGYYPATSIVTVVGSDSVNVNLDLTSLSAPAANPGPRNRAIVGWVATAVLAGGATTFGVLALNANSKLKSDLGSPAAANSDGSAERAQLDSDLKKQRTFAALADTLTGLAVIAGGISVYLTIKAASAQPTEPEAGSKTASAPGVRFDVGPTGATVLGRF